MATYVHDRTSPQKPAEDPRVLCDRCSEERGALTRGWPTSKATDGSMRTWCPRYGARCTSCHREC